MKIKHKFAPPIESVDELAQIATIDTVFYDRYNDNADGTPMRWRVSGRVTRWARYPDRISFPLMHGLYDHYRVYSLDLFNHCFAVSYE